jgi:hypothetical protein
LSLVAAGSARANDTKKNSSEEKQAKHHVEATITNVDTKNDAVSLKMQEKSGETKNETLKIADNAKLKDEQGKSTKLDKFRKGDDVLITEKNDKITSLAERATATITSMDSKAGTVTVKMLDDHGKSVEKTFRLVEDSEYLDNTGEVATCDVFRSGDEVLFIESEGQIQAMKKADHNKDHANSSAKNQSKSEKK